MTQCFVQKCLALLECVEKLSADDRRLISARYAPDATTQSAADELGRTVGSVYKSVGRVRAALLECIRRELAREDHS